MRKKFALKTGVLLLLVIGAATSCSPTAEPVTPVGFYEGNSIELVSTASPGILTDLVLRIMASRLSEDTRAHVVVTTMKGASGMEGMNYLYKAKPDGLTLGVTSSVKFVGNKVFNEPVAEYDFENFSYIMSIGSRLTHFFVSPEGPYQTIAELQEAKDLKLGSSSPSGYFTLANLTVIKMLGLDAKVITGFDNVSAIATAVKRGEITGYAVGINHAMIEAGLIKPLFVLSTGRDPRMPDVPAITELVNLSDEDLGLVRLWETALVNSSLFAAPPNTSEDRLAFLRGMANQWTHDEAFLKEIDAVSGEKVLTYITGEEVNRAMLDTASGLNKFQAIFAELIKKYRA
ncbi:tripartite tricarboxylate transporter substrate-binding protein [Chloroflexota bacterium]